LNNVAFVALATANKEVVGADCVEVETESWLNGEVVPIPIALVVAESVLMAWVQASYEAVMVGETEPTTVNEEHEAIPLQLAEDVATLWYELEPPP
jgi:hypothetical protein